ncbi:peptidylprolyl isomerase [Fundidesulfovibrio butyratiphilus]
MLDNMRQHAQSWAVKAVFAIIIAVFIFYFGQSGMGRHGGSGVLATVGDRPILIKDFLQEVDEQARLAQSQNPNLSKEDLERMGLKQQVFYKMVGRSLLFDQAEKMGVTVSQPELQAFIASIKPFQNDQGKFDVELYKQKIKSLGQSVDAFEQAQRESMLIEKMVSYAVLPAWVTQTEARSLYDFTKEQATVSYLEFSGSEFSSKVDVAKDKLEAFYEADKAKYKRPAEIKIEYIEVSPHSLAKPDQVTEQDMKAYYDANPDKFKHPEMIKASHLLVLLPKDAKPEEVKAAEKRLNDLAGRLRKGEPLSKLIATPGQPAVTGDDLGWFGKGTMVPEFENAAFALKKGEVSAPVRSQYGLHIIWAQDRKAEGVTPYEEAKADIKNELAEEKATETVGKTADMMLEDLLGGSDLAKVAKSQGLAVQSTGFFTRQAPPPDLGLPPTALGTLFSTESGKVVPQAITAGEGFLLTRVVESKPETIPPFDDIADAVKADYVAKEALKLAEAKAKEVAAQIATPEGLAAVEKQYQGQFKTTKPFGRQGFIPELGLAQTLAEAAFSLAAPGWLPDAYGVAKGYVVAKLDGRTLPTDAEWDKDKARVFSQLVPMRQEELYGTYLQFLYDKLGVKVVAQDVLGKTDLDAAGK